MNKKTIKGIMSQYGYNIKRLSDRFEIPYRTVQNWASGQRECPEYIVKMMDEILSKQTGGKEMRYILIDDCKEDMFTKEFDNAEDAIAEGEKDFSMLTKVDKKRRAGFYVLESVNPDEEADNHFDGNIIKQWM